MDLITTHISTLLSSQVVTDVAQIVKHEETAPNYETEFWILMSLAGILVLGIVMYSIAIRTLADSGVLARKLKKKQEQMSFSFLALCFIPNWSPDLGVLLRFDFGDIIALGIVNAVLLWMLLYMHQMFNRLSDIDKKEEEVDSKPLENIAKALTARVSAEEEHTILMDHNYDGIEELDNKLPPWWLWGFYVSIAFGIFYMFHYHVFNTGNSIQEDLAMEVEAAHEAREAYIMKVAMSVNENTVTLMTDADNLAKGKRIFVQHCTKCHGQNGEGLVGPNFTDDYWVYGNEIQDLYKTIKYGANLGMISWVDDLNPLQMQQVASYILSLHGTNPPGQKPPDGDLIPWPEASDDVENTESTEDVESEEIGNEEPANTES